jgi:hypothetical protein
MNYTKPEITMLEQAVDTIQSGFKGIDFYPDAPKNVTTSAYDADE